MVALGGCGSDGREGCASFRVVKVEWQAAHPSRALGDDDRRRRQPIADRIVECGVLREATRSQVRGTLGEPDSRAAGEWLWELGPQPELGGLDSDVLVVVFGANGRVRDIQVATT